MAEDRRPDPIDAWLEQARALKRSIPEPSLEELEAFARGTLEQPRAKELEMLLHMRPDLRLEVDAMRAPSPELRRAFEAGLQRGLAALDRPTAGQRFRRWLEMLSHGPVIAGLAAAVLLLSLAPSMLRHVSEPAPSAPPSEDGSRFRFAAGVRATPGAVAEIPEGESIFVDLEAAGSASHYALLELAGQEVRLLREGALPPRPTVLELGSAPEPAVRLLALVLSSGPVEASALKATIEREIQQRGDLTRIEGDERQMRLEQALEKSFPGFRRLRLSPAFQTRGL